MEIVKEIYSASKAYNPCKLFKGSESFEEMIRLFLTPQGIEFCTGHGFPDIETCRTLKAHNLDKVGIHIDEGAKRAVNPRKIVLVGDCDFELEYNTLEHPCRVVLMHGAKARIIARGFSVVAIDRQVGCSVNVELHDNAIVK